MNKIEYTPGMKFGRLTFVSVHQVGNSKALWNCLCDCGKTKVLRSYSVKHGQTRSCGCLNSELVTAKMTRHGHARLKGTRTYTIWRNMVSRCCNPNDPKAHVYGARGITVCDRWLDFANFLSDMGEAPAGLSIDRRDNDKGYAPENCAWATIKEQNRNTSRTLIVEYRGQRRKLIELCEEAGFRPETVRRRLKTGMPLEAALSAPVRWSTRTAATPSPV